MCNGTMHNANMCKRDTRKSPSHVLIASEASGCAVTARAEQRSRPRAAEERANRGEGRGQLPIDRGRKCDVDVCSAARANTHIEIVSNRNELSGTSKKCVITSMYPHV